MPQDAIALDQRTDPLCLAPEAAAALLADVPWRRFAVIGDSLSLGIGDPTPGYGDAGWAQRVATLLRRVHPGAAELNLGEVGATTDDVLARQTDAMRRFAPDLLHLPCGPNDLMRRNPDFAAIEASLRRLYGVAASTGAQLTTFTLGRAFVVPAFADWARRVRTINAITRAVAAEHGALVVEMYDHPVNDRANLVSADGVHFATVGQAVMAAEYIRAIS